MWTYTIVHTILLEGRCSHNPLYVRHRHLFLNRLWILALAQSIFVSSHMSCGPQCSKNYVHNIPLEQDWYSDVTRPSLVKGWYPRLEAYRCLWLVSGNQRWRITSELTNSYHTWSFSCPGEQSDIEQSCVLLSVASEIIAKSLNDEHKQFVI